MPSHTFSQGVFKWTSSKSSCGVSVTPSPLNSCVLTQGSMRELPPPKIYSKSSSQSTSTLQNCLSCKELLRHLGHASARSSFEISALNVIQQRAHHKMNLGMLTTLYQIAVILYFNAYFRNPGSWKAEVSNTPFGK